MFENDFGNIYMINFIEKGVKSYFLKENFILNIFE